MEILRRIRFEIRLPVYYNDKTEIETEKFEQTRDEIYKKFNAFTLLGTTQGGWRNPITKESFIEPITGFFIDVKKKDFDKAVKYLKKYKKILEKRFKQQEIYIVGYDLYVI